MDLSNARWPVLRQLAGPDKLGRGAGGEIRRLGAAGGPDHGRGQGCQVHLPVLRVGCGQNVYVKDQTVIQIEGVRWPLTPESCWRTPRFPHGMTPGASCRFCLSPQPRPPRPESASAAQPTAKPRPGATWPWPAAAPNLPPRPCSSRGCIRWWTRISRGQRRQAAAGGQGTDGCGQPRRRPQRTVPSRAPRLRCGAAGRFGVHPVRRVLCRRGIRRGSGRHDRAAAGSPAGSPRR